MKTITIIDAFIDNDNNQKLLNEFLLTINSIDPVLLITNSFIDKSIVDKIDYLLYDKNNNLFKNIYTNYEKSIFWGKFSGLKFNEVRYHTQKRSEEHTSELQSH